MTAVKTGLIDVVLFSINPCYDLLPPNEDVDTLWAEESYTNALQNIDPVREQFYTLCEREGVGIDVMKVYGGGDLLNKENSPFGRAMTPVQAIEYALTRPGVAAMLATVGLWLLMPMARIFPSAFNRCAISMIS